jgi:hypothetical protein
MASLKRKSEPITLISDNKRVHRPLNYKWLDQFTAQCHVCSKWTATQHGVCDKCQQLASCAACCVRGVPGCFYPKELLIEHTFALTGICVDLCEVHAALFNDDTTKTDFNMWPIPPIARQGFSWVFPRVFCSGCNCVLPLHELEELGHYDSDSNEFDYHLRYKCADCPLKE